MLVLDRVGVTVLIARGMCWLVFVLGSSGGYLTATMVTTRHCAGQFLCWPLLVLGSVGAGYSGCVTVPTALRHVLECLFRAVFVTISPLSG